MTKVKVHPGNCGFTVMVSAQKGKGKKVAVAIDTECEMIKDMEVDIAELDIMSVFTNHLNNPVYRSAARHIKHSACPVMSAILKAVEVEAGMAVPEDVNICFLNDDGD